MASTLWFLSALAWAVAAYYQMRAGNRSMAFLDIALTAMSVSLGVALLFRSPS